ncbi:MAG: hypothetical protein WC284_09255 [Candidimonas sp.]
MIILPEWIVGTNYAALVQSLRNSNNLSSAFIWSDTEEGSDWWNGQCHNLTTEGERRIREIIDMLDQHVDAKVWERRSRIPVPVNSPIIRNQQTYMCVEANLAMKVSSKYYLDMAFSIFGHKTNEKITIPVAKVRNWRNTFDVLVISSDGDVHVDGKVVMNCHE